MAFHKDEAGLSLHALHAFTFATAVERVAGTGYTITAADIGKVAKQTDANRFYLLVNNSPLTWSEVTAPGGSGGINYISNDGAEDSAASWSAYADAAAASPDDGTGGFPNITITRTTSNPLRTNASFLITKDAVDRQGQGVSFDFTIDRADEAKPLSIEFDYEPLSGFVAGSDSTNSDLVVYIYDLDYSTLIQPAPFKLVGGVGAKHKFLGEFQSSAASGGANARKYRLILHIATTNAAPWTFKFDGVRVGPRVTNYGTPITDWQTYTPAFTGFGTVSVHSMQWRRVGGNVEIKGTFTTGTTTGVEARVGLPSGLTTSDTSVISSIQVCGNWASSVAGAAGLSMLVEPSKTYVTFGSQNAGNGSMFSITGSQINSNNALSIKVSVPIAGWSSNLEMSNDTSTTIVSVEAFKTSINGTQNVSPGPAVKIIFGGTNHDTHSGWSTVNNRYTIPVAGLYSFTINLCLSNAVSNGNVSVLLHKNGSPIKQAQAVIQTAGNAGANPVFIDKAMAGDYYEVFLATTATVDVCSAATVTGGSTFSVKKVSGPAQIAASEIVVARYTSGNTQTIVGADDSAAAIRNYETKVIDTHNAVTTGESVWKFTAPVSGLYRVTAQGESASGGGWDTTEKWALRLFKNSTAYSYLGIDYSEGIHTNRLCAAGTDIVSLKAGEYIDIRIEQTCQSLLGTGNNHQVNYVNIEKIKQ